MNDINILDLYLDKNRGIEQVGNNKKYSLLRKKQSIIYNKFISPLYKFVQNKKDFKFSVSDKDLTCRIAFNDLCNYLNLKSWDDILDKISINRDSLSNDRKEEIKSLIGRK